MKVLNLYAGIGGNRKLWDSSWEVTAVEIDPEIAAIYQEYFPHDRVIVGDAHEYLLNHFQEFDFIWTSPPCPTHSRIRFSFQAVAEGRVAYPDMTLWQEIIFLQYHCHKPWVVENVIPYYEIFIKQSAIRERHVFWSNFPIATKGCVNKADQPIKEVVASSERYGFKITKKTKERKDKILRNLVNPDLGKYIADCAIKIRQELLVA